MRNILTVSVLLFVFVGSWAFAADSSPASASDSYLDIPFQTITGETTCLRDFQGKAVLIVNTASKCGFTPQYEGLQKLYEQYGGKGLVVIGFPANNFLNQEPGSNEEIQSFCRENFGVTFPMMAKISVKGNDIHPLYDYLTTKSLKPGDISWNFNKFLLDKNGAVVNRFGTKVKPDDKKLIAAIDRLLGKTKDAGCADCSECPGCLK